MDVSRSTRVMIGLLAVGVLLPACGARRHKASAQRLDQAFTEARSRRAVMEGTERQIAAAESKKAPAGSEQRLESGAPIWIQSGKSRVIELPHAVKRVSIGNPDLAGIVVLGPRTVLISAKEAPKAEGSGSASRSSGMVTASPLTPEPRMAETTLMIWVGDGPPEIHTVFVADFIDQQVMLDVTVAELNRTSMEEYGIDFRNMANSFVSAYFMGGGLGPGAIGTVPPSSGPLFPLAGTSAAPVYAFNLPKDDITAFIQALQVEGMATILAQPKLLAMSGQAAVFQVGGEIPIRVATGFTADIEYKAFGTLVNFIPRVSEEGDIVLTVTPEVSQPDFNSPVEGIPTFRTRRASTSTRLRDGETFVVGGLMQKNRVETVRGIPYLQDLPLLGYIFRNTHYSDETNELMVIITPHLVRPLPPGEELALPTDRGPLTHEDVRTKPNDAVMTRPRIPGLH
jgi:Flp pilus assembly secretin CpaC